MRAELLQLAAELAQKGEPFVLAVVVRREAYSSAHQGDMAVITAAGGYHGWLGGNCTQPAVRREARLALADGRPRLVAISPEPPPSPRPGVTVLPMACSSGGSVDIYLEPVLPAPRLLVFGPSPVARALAQLGHGLCWRVDAVDAAADGAAYPGADRVLPGAASPEVRALAGAGGDLAIVVATMGESDEEAIEAALALRSDYVGVVASRKRFAQVRASLEARGVAPDPLDRIHNPAGLDVGAVLPEELALSILAEIVQLRRARVAPAVAEPAAAGERPEAREALDPVCGMTVEVAAARHRAEHGGHPYYFCNARCREAFVAAPERYLSARAAAAGAR